MIRKIFVIAVEAETQEDLDAALDDAVIMHAEEEPGYHNRCSNPNWYYEILVQEYPHD